MRDENLCSSNPRENVTEPGTQKGVAETGPFLKIPQRDQNMSPQSTPNVGFISSQRSLRRFLYLPYSLPHDSEVTTADLSSFTQERAEEPPVHF